MIRRQSQLLHQRHDIDEATMKDGRTGEVNRLDQQVIDPIHHAAATSGKEACVHPIGSSAQPEVEACGLDLIRLDRGAGPDHLAPDQLFDVL